MREHWVQAAVSTHPHTAISPSSGQVSAAGLYAKPYALVGQAGRALHAAHHLRETRPRVAA